MEINTPTIEDAIKSIIDQDVDSVVVVPYFLFKGIHFKKDILGRMDIYSCKYPKVEFILADPLGYDNSIGDLLLKRAKESIGNI